MAADDYITQDMLDELQETYPDEIAGFGISAYLGNGQIYKNSDKYANVDATGTTKEELEYKKINIMLLFLVNKIRRFRKKSAALPCIFPPQLQIN